MATAVTSPSPVEGEGQPPQAAGRGPAPSLNTANLLALLIPAALLAGALGFQYIGGLAPCEMCHWQRWPHYAALAIAISAYAAPRPAKRIFVTLAAIAIASSGAIGTYHAGVELGIFTGITSCSATAATGTAADQLAAILAAPIIRCDAIPFSFAGVSMAGWNAILSLASGGFILWLTRRP